MYTARSLLYLVFIATSIGALSAHAEGAPDDFNSIQSIKAIPIAEGEIAIKIGLKNNIVNQPASFTIDTPPRLVFDFQNTTNKFGKSSQAFGVRDLSSINIVQAGTRTRLVINLNQMRSYDTRTEGNSMLITLRGKEVACGTAPATTPRISTADSSGDIPLHDLAIPAQNISPVAVNTAIAPFEPSGSVSMQLNNLSSQQQAENEFRKAYLLMQQGRLREAATGYKAALLIDPAHVLARQALAATLLQSNLNANAEKILQEGIEQNPKQTHFAMQLARLQVERNAVPLALSTLEKTLAYANQQADYQAFVAALLQRLNRNTEAITYYQAALQISPNSGLWLMGLGISMQAEKRKEEALDAYNRAFEAHSLNPELQTFVAQRVAEIKK